MADRFFLMTREPISLTVGGKPIEAVGPKYAPNILTAGGSYEELSLDNVCLCFVRDISESDVTLLSNQSDTRILPLNLDAVIGSGGVSTAQDVLSFMNLPSGWVDQSMSTRTVIRGLTSMVLIRQRAKEADLLGGGRTLTSLVSDIPAANRTKFLELTATLDIDTSGIQGSNTIGSALRTLAARYDQPINFGGEVF